MGSKYSVYQKTNIEKLKPNEFYPTPVQTAKETLDQCFDDGTFSLYRYGVRPDILDPGCGNGAWGEAMRLAIPFRHSYNMYGMDIQGPDEITPHAYTDIALNMDYLDRAAFELMHVPFRIREPWHYNFPQTFDLIVGNPPFSLHWQFYKRSMELLKPGGKLGFILPIEYLAGIERLSHGFYTGLQHVYIYVNRIDWNRQGNPNAVHAFYVWEKPGGEYSCEYPDVPQLHHINNSKIKPESYEE